MEKNSDWKLRKPKFLDKLDGPDYFIIIGAVVLSVFSYFLYLDLKSPLAGTYIFLGLGFLFSYLFYEKYEHTLGGVLVLPLLVVYALRNILLLGLFFAMTVIILIILRELKHRYLLYGRKLYFLVLMLSLLLSAVGVMFMRDLFLLDTVVFSLLPGIYAYNVEREMERAPLQIAVFIGLFILLYLIGKMVLMVEI